jgi:hypothetical protein
MSDNLKVNYLRSCACAGAMDRIASKTFLRLSYEYNICLVRRDTIPSMGAICLKSLIANLSSLRKNTDAVYINLFDLITFGSLELNFDETEKATNILPDFRLGKRGCELCGMDYKKYSEQQTSISEYNHVILNIDTPMTTNSTWNNLLQSMSTAVYGSINLQISDLRLISIFLEIFLEEVLYDLNDNKNKNYAYKLFDILYFTYNDKDDMWGTDVMPEYKLMVKNDAFQELMIENELNEKENKEKEYKGLRYQ